MQRDGGWGPDGSRNQMWLRRRNMDRSTARVGTVNRPLLGLVLEVRHKDNDQNETESYPVYNVMIADREYQGLLLRNVAAIGQKMGENSGLEMTLTAASEAPDISDPTQAMQNILASDGDLVIVQFVSGVFPVIWGCMNHVRTGDSASWHGDSTDGERMALHHKGSKIMIEYDSTISVELEDTKDVTITIDGDQLFKVTNHGGTKTVELGSGGEALVLGDSFRAFFNDNGLLGVPPGAGSVVHHTHTYVGGGGTAETGEPINPGTFAASPPGIPIPDFGAALLSTVSETE